MWSQGFTAGVSGVWSLGFRGGGCKQDQNSLKGFLSFGFLSLRDFAGVVRIVFTAWVEFKMVSGAS